jgi:hypothetical protein
MTASIPDNSEAIERASKIIADAVAQGLMEAEVILGADREKRAQVIPPQLVDTMERFADALTQLAEFTRILGERMNELTDAVTVLAAGREGVAIAAARNAPQEPSFAPGGEGIDVTIAAVPGFQGLMDLQRALVRMPQVQGAAVRRYQDDQAAIQLVLSHPMTPTAIVEGVAAATNRRLVIDEAEPSSLRLRLRFLAEGVVAD